MTQQKKYVEVIKKKFMQDEKKTYHIQMINDNYDIIHNYQYKYPVLYAEICAHDKLSHSSWYDLTEQAYQEYQAYFKDHNTYILENRLSDNRADGWYGGQNKKYADIFDYMPKKEYAMRFKSHTEATLKAQSLNKAGYNFIVINVEPEKELEV